MTSLFFVVAALIEFAIVLLLQRRLDAKTEGTQNKIKATPRTIRRRKVSQMSQNSQHGENVTKPNVDGFDSNMSKIMRLDSIQLSTDDIDMIAFMLFLFLYVLFNLFYWL